MDSKKGELTNRLFLLRAEKKWSQKYVAEQLNVTRQTVHSLESNRYNPSLLLAFEISRLFELPIEDIFQYTKEG